MQQVHCYTRLCRHVQVRHRPRCGPWLIGWGGLQVARPTQPHPWLPHCSETCWCARKSAKTDTLLRAFHLAYGLSCPAAQRHAVFT